MTAYLLFKSGNKRAGTKSKIIVFALSSLECYAVFKSFIIDFGNITHLGRSVFNVNISGVSFKHAVKLCVNLFIRNNIHIFGNFDAFIVFYFNFRLYSYNSSKCISVFRAINQLNICTVNGNNISFFNSHIISVTIGFVYCILIKIFSAIGFFKQCFGSFSLAEARNGKLFAFFSYCGVNGTSEFFGSDFNGKLCFIRSGLFKLCQFHCVSS